MYFLLTSRKKDGTEEPPPWRKKNATEELPSSLGGNINVEEGIPHKNVAEELPLLGGNNTVAEVTTSKIIQPAENTPLFRWNEIS